MVTNFHGADSEVLASMETNWFGNHPFETTWFDWIIWAIYRKYRISNTSVYTPKLRALSMCSACTNMAFTCFLQCCCFRSRTWWALHRENRHIPLLRTDLGYWPGFHFTSRIRYCSLRSATRPVWNWGLHALTYHSFSKIGMTKHTLRTCLISVPFPCFVSSYLSLTILCSVSRVSLLSKVTSQYTKY